MFVANKLGFNVYGTEFDQDAINFVSKYLPSAQLYKGDVFEARYPNDYFDFISVYHVIEHILNPHEYLSGLFEILKKNGILYIGTPDIDALAYKIYRIVEKLLCRIPSIVDGIEHTIIFNKGNTGRIRKEHNFLVLEQYNEPLHESISEIWDSDYSFKKKVLRYAQTKAKINQILVASK